MSTQRARNGLNTRERKGLKWGGAGNGLGCIFFFCISNAKATLLRRAVKNVRVCTYSEIYLIHLSYLIFIGSILTALLSLIPLLPLLGLPPFPLNFLDPFPDNSGDDFPSPDLEGEDGGGGKEEDEQ